MNKPIRIHHPLFKIINNALVDLPAPSNINIWWNFGSLLGLCLSIQILTGLFLAIHYTADIQTAFNSVNHICRDVNNGWLLRTIHANGASFFLFVFTYTLDEEFTLNHIYLYTHEISGFYYYF